MSDLPPVLNQPLASPARATSNLAEQPVAEATATPPRKSSEGISSNRPLVFAVLFGVTGALGLPLLWFSPAFTTKEKWLWSIVNLLYTAGLIAIAIAALQVIFDAMAQLA